MMKRSHIDFYSYLLPNTTSNFVWYGRGGCRIFKFFSTVSKNKSYTFIYSYDLFFDWSFRSVTTNNVEFYSIIKLDPRLTFLFLSFFLSFFFLNAYSFFNQNDVVFSVMGYIHLIHIRFSSQITTSFNGNYFYLLNICIFHLIIY